MGCGNGELYQKLAARAFDVYGIDCSIEAIENAQEIDSKSKYYEMDTSSLSFQSGFFDLIIVKVLFIVIVDSAIRKK